MARFAASGQEDGICDSDSIRDRLHPTRVPRSCDRAWRAASAACAGRVPTILQRHPDTSGFGQRLTADEVCPENREHSAAADPRRIAPSLRPDLISDTDRARRTPVAVKDGAAILDFICKPRSKAALVALAKRCSPPVGAISAQLLQKFGPDVKLTPVKLFVGICVRAVLENEGFQV